MCHGMHKLKKLDQKSNNNKPYRRHKRTLGIVPKSIDQSSRRIKPERYLIDKYLFLKNN